jgi:hypothetical protein
MFCSSVSTALGSQSAEILEEPVDLDSAVSADRIINGRASVSFQRPFFEWPETWPIRRE